MLSSRFGLKVKTLCLSLTITFLCGHVLISIITYDIQGVEAKFNYMPEEFDPALGFGSMMDLDETTPNEIGLESGKRFKLYEKKRMNYEKAKKFCKKREGSLAEAKNVDEMRRLQMLLMKARMVGGDMWVGTDKKEWKKHSSKMLGMERPNLGPQAMMLGGGPTQMCPGLSSSTRSLNPVPCYKELPFVCEFEPGKGLKKITKTKSNANAKGKENQTGSKSSKSGKNMKKDEMKRKKREIVKLSQADTETATTESTFVEMKKSTFPTVPLTLNEIDTTTTINAATTLTDNLDLTTETDENSAAVGHHIGFIPHVIHIEGEPENEQVLITSSSSSSVNDAALDIVEISNLLMYEAKLSTRLMVGDRENENVQNLGMMMENNRHMSSTTDAEPTLLMNTKQLISEADPDQAMLDLINEQSELQSLESMHIGLSQFSNNSSNIVEAKSFMLDEYASTMSTLEVISENNETTNEGEQVKAGESNTEYVVKAKVEKRGKNTVAASETSTSDLSEEKETSFHDKFTGEPLVKNVSRSLLEPTVTIELNTNKDHKHQHSNETQEVPRSLLSPLDNSTSKNQDSRPPTIVTTTARPNPMTYTSRSPTMITTSSILRKLTTMKVEQSTSVQRKDDYAKSTSDNIRESTAATKISTTPTTDKFVQTQETTSANIPFNGSSTPSLLLRLISPSPSTLSKSTSTVDSNSAVSANSTTMMMKTAMEASTENDRSSTTMKFEWNSTTEAAMNSTAADI